MDSKEILARRITGQKAILRLAARISFIRGEDGLRKALETRTKIARLPVMVAALLAVAAPAIAQSEIPSDDLAAEGTRFARVYGILEQNYMETIDPDRAILEGAIRGMLFTLDPFSSFFNADQFDLLKQQEKGKTLGFGSILYVVPGKVVVLQTAENSPTWRAGVGPGDEIVEVNGTRLDRLDFQSLVQLLAKSRSQPVTLGVIHPGKIVPEYFHLNPAEVAVPTVDKSFLVAAGVGYLHLTGFEEKTPDEIEAALGSLGVQGLRGLILDLRDNHGGMVSSAIATASLFLKAGTTALTVKGRVLPERIYTTVPMPEHFDVPVMLVVNGNTASAAEIFTAALEENDRALVVGEPTFGKGVVESVMPLSEKCGLALITAQYLTSRGRSIQRALPGTELAGAVTANPFTAVASGLESATGRQRTASKENLTGPRTAAGRPLSPGGGISPDVDIPSAPLDPWLAFLDGRGVFTDFASEYLTRHGRADQSFGATAEVLGEFRGFLRRQGIRAPDKYWAPDEGYLRLRIKAEVFNLVFGLTAGDKVETLGDPEIQKAVALFSELSRLLKAPQEEPDHLRAVSKEKP